MKLSDKTCKNAKPQERPYKLFDGGGLFLEVMPNGSKLWRLKYRFLGKEKRIRAGIIAGDRLAGFCGSGACDLCCR